MGNDLFQWCFSSRRTCGLCPSWQAKVTPQSPLTWSSWLTLTPRCAVCFQLNSFSPSRAPTQTSAKCRYVFNSAIAVCFPRAPPDTIQFCSHMRLLGGQPSRASMATSCKIFCYWSSGSYTHIRKWRKILLWKLLEFGVEGCLIFPSTFPQFHRRAIL